MTANIGTNIGASIIHFSDAPVTSRLISPESSTKETASGIPLKLRLLRNSPPETARMVAMRESLKN